MGPDGKRRRRGTVSVFATVLENQGLMQIVQADCARARGAGGPPPGPPPPPRDAPPLAINALRVREAGVTVNKALINDSFAK